MKGKIRFDFFYFLFLGNTWIQEMVYLICNEADCASAEAKAMLERVMLLESSIPGLGRTIDKTLSLKGKERLMSTHLTYKYDSL